MIIHDVEQGSEAWFALRLGKMTGSEAYPISVAGKGLETLCRKLAAERYTGNREETYMSFDMQRGKEEEPIIRSYYELLKGVEVTEVGFVEFNEYVGCSPDGLVGKDGGVEFKSRKYEVYNDLLLGERKNELGYIWQCKMNMLNTGREWWDLVNYNPLFKDKSMHITRYYRDKEDDKILLAGYDKGIELINEYLKRY